MAERPELTTGSRGVDVFARVLVGVDGSEQGITAATQAARLVEPGGTLELATAVYLIEAALQSWPPDDIASALEREARPVVAAAAAAAGPQATTRLLNGPPLLALIAEAARYRATLVAVGSHGHSRFSELLLGGVSGPLLHNVGCSVLVARDVADHAAFPARVVVGVDGSPSSLDALAAGRHVARRFGVPLHAVLARFGDVDVVHAELQEPDVEIIDGSPVDALVSSTSAGELLIVGNRGVHGFHTLGSVSERVAHKAPSSVLVVRRGPAAAPWR